MVAMHNEKPLSKTTRGEIGMYDSMTPVQPKYNDKGGEKLRNPPRASGRNKNTRQFAGFPFSESNINQSYIIDVLNII